MKPPRMADNIHCIHPFYYRIMDYVLSAVTSAGAGGPGNKIDGCTAAQQLGCRAHRVAQKVKDDATDAEEQTGECPQCKHVGREFVWG